MTAQKTPIVKWNIFDFFVLILINLIGGFAILYLFVWRILPEHPSPTMSFVVILFSLCVAYIEIRLFWMMAFGGSK